MTRLEARRRERRSVRFPEDAAAVRTAVPELAGEDLAFVSRAWEEWCEWAHASGWLNPGPALCAEFRAWLLEEQSGLFHTG